MTYAPRVENGRAVPDLAEPAGTATYVTTVEALDHLPPTAENLVKLSD